eukprot:1161224-Pelagomonas_calceolata.AAC.1
MHLQSPLQQYAKMLAGRAVQRAAARSTDAVDFTTSKGGGTDPSAHAEEKSLASGLTNSLKAKKNCCGFFWIVENFPTSQAWNNEALRGKGI